MQKIGFVLLNPILVSKMDLRPRPYCFFCVVCSMQPPRKMRQILTHGFLKKHGWQSARSAFYALKPQNTREACVVIYGLWNNHGRQDERSAFNGLDNKRREKRVLSRVFLKPWLTKDAYRVQLVFYFKKMRQMATISVILKKINFRQFKKMRQTARISVNV